MSFSWEHFSWQPDKIAMQSSDATTKFTIRTFMSILLDRSPVFPLLRSLYTNNHFFLLTLLLYTIELVLLVRKNPTFLTKSANLTSGKLFGIWGFGPNMRLLMKNG